MSLTNLKAITVVVAAMVVMLYVGALDDIRGLSSLSRLVIESLTMVGLIYAGGGCIDTFHGLWGIGSFSWWIAVPLTIFVGVGIINAVNMIDGVNGLSSTLCLLSSGLYGIVFLKSGDVANARRGTIRVIQQRDSKGIPTIVTLS